MGPGHFDMVGGSWASARTMSQADRRFGEGTVSGVGRARFALYPFERFLGRPQSQTRAVHTFHVFPYVASTMCFPPLPVLGSYMFTGPRPTFGVGTTEKLRACDQRVRGRPPTSALRIENLRRPVGDSICHGRGYDRPGYGDGRPIRRPWSPVLPSQ